jgi:hypothetical protein
VGNRQAHKEEQWKLAKSVLKITELKTQKTTNALMFGVAVLVVSIATSQRELLQSIKD